MARLIDADALEDTLLNHGFYYCNESDYSDGVAYGFLLAREDLKEAPTIDALEVVRCKDCKYMTEHDFADGNIAYWTCSVWDSGTNYDGYCHYGERREE